MINRRFIFLFHFTFIRVNYPFPPANKRSNRSSFGLFSALISSFFKKCFFFFNFTLNHSKFLNVRLRYMIVYFNNVYRNLNLISYIYYLSNIAYYQCC